MTRTVRVLAPNPGPFTLEGTNTWLVGEEPRLVIDPGPDDPAHLDRVCSEAGRVDAILLTHHHPDHAPGARSLSGRTGAPVLAFAPEHGERSLAGGDSVRGGGVRLVAVHTPGHTPDHLSFHDPSEGSLFTGDAVLGRGTSIIDPPEGDLALYLRSLRIMLDLEPRVIYPGHGPAVWEGTRKLLEYVEHRALRERQVLDGLEHLGAGTAWDLVPSIYSDVSPVLHPAAARSVLAHLLKLESEGRAVRVGSEPEPRFALAPNGTSEGQPTDHGGPASQGPDPSPDTT